MCIFSERKLVSAMAATVLFRTTVSCRWKRTKTFFTVKENGIYLWKKALLFGELYFYICNLHGPLPKSHCRTSPGKPCEFQLLHWMIELLPSPLLWSWLELLSLNWLSSAGWTSPWCFCLGLYLCQLGFIWHSSDLAQFEIIFPSGRWGGPRGAESWGMLQNCFVSLGHDLSAYWL